MIIKSCSVNGQSVAMELGVNWETEEITVTVISCAPGEYKTKEYPAAQFSAALGYFRELTD